MVAMSRRDYMLMTEGPGDGSGYDGKSSERMRGKTSLKQ